MTTFQKVKLKDICVSVDYGFTASSSKINIGPKFLRITDIVPPTINWSDVPYCKIPDKEKDKYLLSEGDIVIARTGATTGYGKYIKNPPISIFASYLVRFKINKENNSRYAGHIIESKDYKDFITNNLGGSAQPQANAQVLGSYELFLPDLLTQNNIASILTTYNELIENNEKRIKTLEEMAQLLYTEWFVKLKFPGHEKVKKDDSKSSYGMIPRGWEVKKLSDIIQIKKGKNITKNTVVDGDVPVVAGGTDPAYYHNVSNTISPVITISASGAGAGFVKLYYKDIWASDCSYIDKNITEYVYFFYLFLKNKQKEISNLQRGSAQPHVYPKDLMTLKIIYSLDIISKFNTLVTPLFELVNKLNEKNSNLTKTRDLLIPQLVTGKRQLKN